MPELSMQDKVVVVTGAAGGIGAALAGKMASLGARVVISDIDAERAHAVAADLGATLAAGDAATEEGVAALVETVQEEVGPIDAWFANAGVDLGTGLESTEEAWATSWDVNVMAHVRAARLLVPGWVERGEGWFVSTASAAGLLTMIGAPAYSVSKHGAVAFAEWLSVTYRHRGVRVHTVCPQGVQTSMLERAGELQSVLGRDRVLTPEEVADATWEAMQEGRFLVLPHTEVREYYRARAHDTDAWIGGMNRLQQKVESNQ
ncbi:MAG: SDR family oxidoreductase [Intrasporangiaceae bacterium]|nr:SDR family oxidoreductase [Intrasporangiaceae bacterium]